MLVNIFGLSVIKIKIVEIYESSNAIVQLLDDLRADLEQSQIGAISPLEHVIATQHLLTSGVFHCSVPCFL